MRSADRFLNVEELRTEAARRMPAPIFGYLDGGAEEERTIKRNRDAFSELALIPRSMAAVSSVDASTTLFGIKVAWPFIVGPTGMTGLFDIAGELAVARAAEAAGAIYTLSTMASRSIEEVAASTNSPKLFQLYLYRDRAISRDLIHRAKAAGYAGLMLTIDATVPANRERDKRTGLSIPPKLTMRSVANFAFRPRWCWDQLLRRPTRLANFGAGQSSQSWSVLSSIDLQFEADIGWADLEWVAREWGGPLAIKGVLRPEDAVRAVASGATTIILSNHGGRQLDSAVSPMDVLEQCFQEVGDTADIVLDGGIRRGTDMLKAMALGAKGCMSGRVGLYGLAAAGEPGARRAFALLREEFERDLALLGAPTIPDISRLCVKRLDTERRAYSGERR